MRSNDCPKCGYAMSVFDVECPRCKRNKQHQENIQFQQNHNVQNDSVHQKKTAIQQNNNKNIIALLLSIFFMAVFSVFELDYVYCGGMYLFVLRRWIFGD